MVFSKKGSQGFCLYECVECKWELPQLPVHHTQRKVPATLSSKYMLTSYLKNGSLEGCQVSILPNVLTFSSSVACMHTHAHTHTTHTHSLTSPIPVLLPATLMPPQMHLKVQG